MLSLESFQLENMSNSFEVEYPTHISNNGNNLNKQVFLGITAYKRTCVE